MSVGAESRARSSRSADTSAALTDVPPRSTPTTGPEEEFTIVGTIKLLDGARVEVPQAVPHVPRGPRRRERRRRRRALRLHRTVRCRGGACAGPDARGHATARHAAAATEPPRAEGRDTPTARRPGYRPRLLPPPVAPDPGHRQPRRPAAVRVLALPGLPGVLRRGREGEQAHRQADGGRARPRRKHPE